MKARLPLPFRLKPGLHFELTLPLPDGSLLLRDGCAARVGLGAAPLGIFVGDIRSVVSYFILWQIHKRLAAVVMRGPAA